MKKISCFQNKIIFLYLLICLKIYYFLIFALSVPSNTKYGDLMFLSSQSFRLSVLLFAFLSAKIFFITFFNVTGICKNSFKEREATRTANWTNCVLIKNIYVHVLSALIFYTNNKQTRIVKREAIHFRFDLLNRQQRR